MSLEKLGYTGLDLQTEYSCVQFTIPAGAGALLSNANATAGGAGVITFTTNAAHGLTLTPTAPAPPNYFVTFGASMTLLTGTGTLIGNVFRILSIPSATTFTIWGTITTATVTATTVIPVFYPAFGVGFGSGFAGGPTQTISSVVTPQPPPLIAAGYVYFRGGANAAARVNTDQTALILDPTSTPTTGTPAVAPTWRDQIPASTNGTAWLCQPWGAIWANGATATSTFQMAN
jgi:hypothetical protein